MQTNMFGSKTAIEEVKMTEVTHEKKLVNNVC